MKTPIVMLAVAALLGGCAAYDNGHDGYGRRGYEPDGYYGGSSTYPRRDSDRDGIPDAYDRHPYGTYRYREPDRDRDGVPDSRDRDLDGDGIRNKYDANPESARNRPSTRDIDGDGVRNKYDRDRDGDGVRNKDDRTPDGGRRIDAHRHEQRSPAKVTNGSNSSIADLDGDGVPNYKDRYPEDARRH